MSSPAREVAIGIPYFNAGLCVDPDCSAVYDVTRHRAGCPNCSEPGFLRLAVPLSGAAPVSHRSALPVMFRPLALATLPRW